jgi:hypothetical protein
MKFTDVYLDMDGVMCDFVAAFLRLHGREELYGKLAVPELHVALDMPFAAAWSPMLDVGARWWADLAPLPWVNELYRFAADIGTVTVLTSPLWLWSPNHIEAMAACSHGKLWWLNRNYPGDIRAHVFTERKAALARPGALLIDDRPDMYKDDFQAKGGEVLVMPQSYNSHHGDVSDPMMSLRHQYADLMEVVRC